MEDDDWWYRKTKCFINNDPSSFVQHCSPNKSAFYQFYKQYSAINFKFSIIKISALQGNENRNPGTTGCKTAPQKWWLNSIIVITSGLGNHINILKIYKKFRLVQKNILHKSLRKPNLYLTENLNKKENLTSLPHSKPNPVKIYADYVIYTRNNFKETRLTVLPLEPSPSVAGHWVQ